MLLSLDDFCMTTEAREEQGVWFGFSVASLLDSR